MARLAWETGTTEMVLTPHVFDGVFENEPPSYDYLIEAFKVKLVQQGIGLILHRGGEVHLSEHIVRLYELNSLPYLGCYRDEKVLLLELPHGDVPPGTFDVIQWLRVHAIRPLIAHPERNRELMRKPERLHEFVHWGCGFQLTASSLLGGFGASAQELAWRIIDANWCLAVASDGHNLRARRPVLKDAFMQVAARCGHVLADKLFNNNPRVLLYGSQV